MVKLELYRVFREVAEAGNISLAAENLYLSQSAVSQSIKQLEQQLGRKEAREVITFSSKPEDRFITLKEYVECLKTLIRSSIAGTVVGALPGLGAPVASFFAYDQAVKHSKEPETFGKGRLEGIAASESANSAVVASSLIPLFTLGIPGNMAAALLIGLLVRRPFMGLNHFMEEKLEETELF